MITIYLPDPAALSHWVELFRDRGFVDTDWCEMRNGDGQVVDYGPCERRPDDDGR